MKNAKRNISLFIAISLLAGLFLAACSGTTVVDVNLDPTTGSGNIVVTGNDEEPASSDSGDAGDATVGNTDMSQVVLFGVVIAVLLGTAAIIISASRRSSQE